MQAFYQVNQVHTGFWNANLFGSRVVTIGEAYKTKQQAKARCQKHYSDVRKLVWAEVDKDCWQAIGEAPKARAIEQEGREK